MSGIKSSKNIIPKVKKYPFLKLPSTEATQPTVTTFSPSQVSGMKAWYDADSVLGLLDGATLSTWRDISGNGFDLTTAAGTVTIKRNIIGGKSVVRFTGSQRMSCANILVSKTNVSAFFVICPRSTVWNIPMEQGLSDFSYESTGDLAGRFYVGGVGGAQGPSNAVQDTFQYTSVLAFGNQLKQWKNGLAGTPVSYSGNTGTSTFNLGARSNNSFFSTFDIAELIIYDRTVTDTERQNIEAYFAAKYSFSVSQPTFPTGLSVRARWAPEDMSSTGSVFTWLDSSGNGYHASKGSGSIPSIVTGLNGLNAAQGTNSSDRRLLAANSSSILSFMPRHAFWAVFKTPATPQNLHSVFGASSFNGTDGNGFATNMANLEFTSGSYPCTMQFRHATNNRRKQGGTLYTEIDVTSTQTFTANQWVAFYLEMDGYNIRANWNGSWTTDIEQTGMMIPANSSFYLMGTNYAPDFQFGGQLHEVGILYDTPTIAQRTQLLNYIKTRYGLAMN